MGLHSWGGGDLVGEGQAVTSRAHHGTVRVCVCVYSHTGSLVAPGPACMRRSRWSRQEEERRRKRSSSDLGGTHTHIHTCIHTVSHSYTQTHTRTRTCTHTQSVIVTHTYTHTHSAGDLSAEACEEQQVWSGGAEPGGGAWSGEGAEPGGGAWPHCGWSGLCELLHLRPHLDNRHMSEALEEADAANRWCCAHL